MHRLETLQYEFVSELGIVFEIEIVFELGTVFELPGE